MKTFLETPTSMDLKIFIIIHWGDYRIKNRIQENIQLFLKKPGYSRSKILDTRYCVFNLKL